MFKKIKNWIVVKWKYLLVVLGLSVSIVFAAGELPKENLGNSLDLKAPKENILYSREYTENEKQIVSYAYKSDEIVLPFANEIIEKRTENIVTRNLGGNKRSAQSGYSFYKENGKWKQVKFATTTPEVFNQVSWIKKVLAADTGATSPGTMADDDAVGQRAWLFVNNAKTSDNSYAEARLYLGGPLTHYLKATNFGFSIPSDVTINGILVEIEKRAGDTPIHDYAVKIVKSNGTIGATNKANVTDNWPTTFTYISYGNSTDLWGESWNDTDINSANFGVVLSGDDIIPIGVRLDVDHMRITVYYTEAPAGTNTQINIGDAWKDIEAIQINIGDVWKDVEGAQINIGDSWKTIY